jgi:hypothetical protein
MRALLCSLVVLGAAAPSALADSVSTTVKPQADCTIYSGTPSSSATCGRGGDDLVGSDGNGSLYRTMIAFPAGLGIPPGAKVLSSTLTINVAGAFGSTPSWVFAMTRSFTRGAATWNSYDGVHGWNTPGGDFNDTLQASATVGAAGSVSFPITRMTQSWLDGSAPVPALMVLGYAPKGNAYSFASLASGHGPYLSLVYQPPGPITTPIPLPKPLHRLKVRMLLSWNWRHGTTWLDKATIGRFPARMRLTIRCTGRGCGHPRTVTARGGRAVNRLLRALAGRRYRAGDVLHITFTAPGRTPERAEVIIRDGRKPRVRAAK